jgi:hypothetical protein
MAGLIRRQSKGDCSMAKTSSKQGSIRGIESDGKRVAKKAAYSPFMDRLTRLGYAVKGLIYITIGLIAVQGALGKSSTPADQLGAIRELSKLPYASFILWVILIGLVSYSLWGLIRAFLDPFHKGTDMKGLLTRGGFLMSAITYASFVLPTYHLIIGTRRGAGPNQTMQFVTKLMTMPWGRFMVGAVGVAGVAAGLYQIYMGITLNFDQEFKPYALTRDQLRIAKQVGRFGTIARGVVFALVGYFLCLAAYYARPGQAQGFNGALNFLARQPYGLWLMGIIAAGLIAFGIYSLMSAAWFRLKDSQ